MGIVGAPTRTDILEAPILMSETMFFSWNAAMSTPRNVNKVDSQLHDHKKAPRPRRIVFYLPRMAPAGAVSACPAAASR